jgi:hypothetical protein
MYGCIIQTKKAVEVASNKALVIAHSGLGRFRAPQYWRVCQAWHLTSRVKVLIPGIRRAEG